MSDIIRPVTPRRRKSVRAYSKDEFWDWVNYAEKLQAENEDLEKGIEVRKGINHTLGQSISTLQDENAELKNNLLNLSWDVILDEKSTLHKSTEVIRDWAVRTKAENRKLKLKDLQRIATRCYVKAQVNRSIKRFISNPTKFELGMKNLYQIQKHISNERGG